MALKIQCLLNLKILAYFKTWDEAQEGVSVTSEFDSEKVFPISVVIPVHNSEEWIRETLLSVCNQEMAPHEIIIVNDGSTDRSLEVIRTVCIEHPDIKILIHTIENSGVSIARNIGINLCSGDLIALLDSDDVWLPQKLWLQHSFLVANLNFVAVLSDFYISSPGNHGALKDLRLITKKHVKDVGRSWLTLTGNGALLSSTIMFWRGRVVGKATFLDNLSTTADLSYYLQLSEIGKVGHIFKPLVRYRQHANQMHSNAKLLKRDFPILFESLEHANIKNYKKLSFANMYIMGGILEIAQKHFRDGFIDLWKGLRIKPSSLILIPCTILYKRLKSYVSLKILHSR
jgi:glycosyltransferase involved in cell wall biosynthesis